MANGYFIAMTPHTGDDMLPPKERTPEEPLRGFCWECGKALRASADVLACVACGTQVDERAYFDAYREASKLAAALLNQREQNRHRRSRESATDRDGIIKGEVLCCTQAFLDEPTLRASADALGYLVLLAAQGIVGNLASDSLKALLRRAREQISARHVSAEFTEAEIERLVTRRLRAPGKKGRALSMLGKILAESGAVSKGFLPPMSRRND